MTIAAPRIQMLLHLTPAERARFDAILERRRADLEGRAKLSAQALACELLVAGIEREEAK